MAVDDSRNIIIYIIISMHVLYVRHEQILVLSQGTVKLYFYRQRHCTLQTFLSILFDDGIYEVATIILNGNDAKSVLSAFIYQEANTEPSFR
jgi:hypothetical protein